MGLPFTADAHAAVADGTITVTYRAWKRPMVKVGGRYTVGTTVVEVTALTTVPAASVPGDARARLGDADPVWRVDFHRVDPLPARVLSHDEIATRLERLDRASSHGPWTRATLALIRDHPGVVSTRLAAMVGRERMPFKADVRKLKALGLTESLEVGYRLSPLGAAHLDAGGRR
jgi:hypothetical protein